MPAAARSSDIACQTLGHALGAGGIALGNREKKTAIRLHHHTERGFLYASETYRKALEAAGLKGPMSAVGNPYHNARAESFVKTMKVEDMYSASYKIFADVTDRLPRFIIDDLK
ncbi:hypothetical protein [Shinella sp.]|uniref:hypothetical protein n=1 Tax=Shinella sp. TaxID=1870904 RepID=UPI003F6EFD2E